MTDFQTAISRHYNLQKLPLTNLWLYRKGAKFVLFGIDACHLRIYHLSDRTTIERRKSSSLKLAHRIIIDGWLTQNHRGNTSTNVLELTNSLSSYPLNVVDYCDPKLVDIIEDAIKQ